MNKINRAIVIASFATSGALLGTVNNTAFAQTITIASWENLVTPPPPDPVPLPDFFRRPIGSAGIDGTHDFDNRSVYTSDTFGATNGTKSVKQQIAPGDTGGAFTFCLNVQLQEVGAVGNFLASGQFLIDVSFKNSDFDNGGTGNGYAGINQLAVNSVGTGVGFLDRGKATHDSFREGQGIPEPDPFKGFWDKSFGDVTTTLTWDLTDLVDGSTTNNEISAVQANSGGGFLHIVLSTVYDSAFDPSLAAFRFDNVRLVPRVVTSEWTGLAPDPDGNAGNGNAAIGLWHASQNWTVGVAGAANSVATFGTNGGALVGAQTVNTNQGTPIGTINFNNAAGYTIGGTGSITLSATAGAGINVLAGSHTINTPVTLESNSTVNVAPAGSTLTIASLQESTASLTKAGPGTLAVNNVRASALNVNAGTVSVLPNGTNAGASRVGTLAITAGATMDLRDNNLVVTSGSYNAVRTLIASGRNGGNWNGTGLTSSTAGAATPKNKTLGLVTGAQYLSTSQTTFDGFTVAASDVLVKFTWYGDTDFNGVVNFDDYSRTDNGFNSGGTNWFSGDFDYNGIVNFDDYSLIDLAFNTQSGTLRDAMSYLDGSDRDDSKMTGPSLQKVLEHYNQFGEGYATSFLSAVPEPTGVIAMSALAAFGAGKRRRRM